MACFHNFPIFLVLVLVLSLLISLSEAQPSLKPKALLLPVSKDASSLQYLTHFNQRTPQVPVNLVVHIGGDILWVDCDKGYVSSSYRPARCRSAQCSLARSNGCSECYGPPRPGCNNNTCGVSPYNPFILTSTSGDIGEDILSMQSTDGSNPGPRVTVPRFLFSCAPTLLLRRLASGATGIAALGRSKVSLPSQLSATFSFSRKFAICLPSSTSSNGIIIFGNGPYKMLPDIDISALLSFSTPLVSNPRSLISAPLGTPSYEYYIGVTSIKINDKVVPLNKTLLTIDSSSGRGGTMISTVDPYTVLHSSIYKAFLDVFVKEAEAMKLTRVPAVAPFGACFSSKNIARTLVGPTVPMVNLVLKNKNVLWSFHGANSMVQVKDDVMCLGFVDGGLKPDASIVLGGYQLENHLLQIDLATSKLSFSSSLLFERTTCSNFNFTSKA